MFWIDFIVFVVLIVILIGDVIIEVGVLVWFNVVLCGDYVFVVVCEGVNV